jgi:hypothetical protein
VTFDSIFDLEFETKVRFVHCHDISEETFSREGGNEVSNTMD